MVKNCKHHPSTIFQKFMKILVSWVWKFRFLFLPTEWVKILLEIVSKWPTYEVSSPEKKPHCFKLALEVSFLFLPTEWVKIIHEIVSKWLTYQAPSPKNILFIRKGGSFVMMKFLKIKKVNFGKEWEINIYILSCIF